MVGPVEVDESFVGGKIGNMHRSRVAKLRAEMPADHAMGTRLAAITRLPWSGCSTATSRQVRAKVVPNVKRETLQREILKNVKYGTEVFTDSAVAYDTLRRRYIHDNLDEQVFRFNNRARHNDASRFREVVQQLTGKRLTYEELTGKVGKTRF